MRTWRHLLLLATGVARRCEVLLGLPNEVVAADVGLLSLLELIVRKWQVLWNGNVCWWCGLLIDYLVLLVLLLVFHR